jgi:hypothetical protein
MSGMLMDNIYSFKVNCLFWTAVSDHVLIYFEYVCSLTYNYYIYISPMKKIIFVVFVDITYVQTWSKNGAYIWKVKV